MATPSRQREAADPGTSLAVQWLRLRLPINARGEGLISGWGAKMVKHLLTMQEIQVPFLGQEDPLEKETATHSSTLAWKILGT